MSTGESGDLAERLEAVRARIADAARTADRDPAGITTIVVTKFHPVSLVRELYELGVRDIGESRHQEAREKARQAADLSLTWHFVGQLQSKKARQAREYASVVHSIDRPSLIDALASNEASAADGGTSHDGVIDCFLQLNLTDDPARGGVAPSEVEAMAERVLAAPGLRLVGVMGVPGIDADPRAAFAEIREASERLRTIAPDAAWISAGMSGDYREAILEGATHLRIGTAITGNRPAHG